MTTNRTNKQWKIKRNKTKQTYNVIQTTHEKQITINNKAIKKENNISRNNNEQQTIKTNKQQTINHRK